VPLADLYNIPMTNDEMKRWSFAHAAHHREMLEATRRLKNVALAEYILDPVNLALSESFFDQHQIMHNDINAVFKISSFDLTVVDWSNSAQRAGWIWLNALQHQLEAQATGVY
jgi:hypothetical protein